MAEIQLVYAGGSSPRGAIVFIHGLGGDRRTTWQCKEGDSDTFWPHWLQDEFRDLAVYSIGYEAAKTSWVGNAMGIPSQAETIAATMEGHEALSRLPLIFVCHSLGGLIVKQILIDAIMRHDSRSEGVLQATSGVIFIATPHAGSKLADWLYGRKWWGLASAATVDLETDTDELLKLAKLYRDKAPNYEIRTLSFAEEYKTSRVMVVSKMSSDPGVPNEEIIPIPANHIDIAKPRDRAATLYTKVVDFIGSRFRPNFESEENGAETELNETKWLAPADAAASEKSDSKTEYSSEISGLLERDASPEDRGASEPTVVISYSHKDERWKDLVARHLNVVAMQGRLRLWDDRKLEAGAIWEREIDREFGQAAASILLVSAHSLSSKFILMREIEILFRRRKQEGMRIIPIVVSDCAWDSIDWLKAINVLPRDGKPLEAFSEADQNTIIASVTRELLSFLSSLSYQGEVESAQIPLSTSIDIVPSFNEVKSDFKAPQVKQESALGPVRERYLDPEERRRLFVAQLSNLLKGADDVIEALGKRLGRPFESDEVGAKELAEILIDLQIKNAIVCLQDTFQKLVQQARRAGASTICQVTRLVLPAVFNPETIQALESGRADINATLIPLSAATKTVAEFVMAGADGRAASHRDPAEGEEWPGGEFELPTPPEGGRQSFGEQFENAFHKHLINQFTDREHQLRFPPDVLQKRVATRLKTSADQGQTYYYVFSLADREAANPEIKATVGRLKLAYPSIIFVQLSNDPNLYLDETEMFDGIRGHLGPTTGQG